MSFLLFHEWTSGDWNRPPTSVVSGLDPIITALFLQSPHSWLPWYHLLLTYLLTLWPPFTSSLWALYSSSLPIHIVISCIYLIAFLPLNVSITWPYYSSLHLLLLRPGLVPGAGMQHPGGSPSVVNTSTKINTVECQWLKIKQVKEGFFFFYGGMRPLLIRWLSHVSLRG